MNDIIHKTVTCEFTKADDTGRVMHGFMGSTIHEDRDGDILDPKGADLTDYKTNPVFLADHTYSVRQIVGKTFDHQVTDQGVKFSVEWDLEDPSAAVVAGKYARKFARAISVGFRGTEATQRKNLPEGHFAFKGESQGIYFEKWDVREFSAVAVPANPNALAAGLGMKGIQGDGFKAWLLDAIAKDKDIRSAVRGLLMGAQVSEGSEEPAAVLASVKSWLGRSS